ncbi:hypothetical protein J437_LFUL016252 [Ladona fulva]|uniref:Tc1-like transposase DDE domain-containing protein n=1 Tax=Ladona fulva TaxID=123851 RepID=A0A8K0P669_LADFU|nr:hypothetical protein J437_LFUL016252 [Ladona fulva]
MDKCWPECKQNLEDTNIKTARQAFSEGLSVGLRGPASRGPRFAMVHAGNESGFVEGAELTYLCQNNMADAHEELDGDRYEKWFTENLLPDTPDGAVIVLDNASYHSRKCKVIPSNILEEGGNS